MENSTANIPDCSNYLSRFCVRDMYEWDSVAADLIITDPPFGIKFSGKADNYNRDVGQVVDGYVEWEIQEYKSKIQGLLDCISENLQSNGQALVFSGWNNSHIIHREIIGCDELQLQGKLYWSYNFAPYCRKRPAHNVYEIYWMVRSDSWYYSNTCSTSHCQDGEANLSTLIFKRDYKKNMPKYPTRLPFEMLKCLLEHYSREGDLIFDPLAGSGMVGIVAAALNRDFLLGDLNRQAKLVYEKLLNHYDLDGAQRN